MTTLDLEKLIAAQIIADALAAGYLIDVYDGGETTLRASADELAITAAMFSTDCDALTLRTPAGRHVGVILLIWGNGCDVISDYSDKPEVEAVLARAMQTSEAAQ